MLKVERRILTIDGGGIKGVFPISFLAALERTTGQPIVRFFDLVVGTSTGGIIALSLGLGYTAEETLQFFEQLGPQVFAGIPIVRLVRKFGLAKYDSTPLRRALEAKFGDRLLGNSIVRLVIPSANLETGRVHIFKTAHHARFATDYKIQAVDVALATAAAPTYFPTHNMAAGIPLIDGGIWANNPTGVAAVEALGILGWRAETLRILSLGCTQEPLNFGLARRIGLGIIPWGFKGVQVFLAAQSSGSMGTANILIGHDSVVRVDPVVAPGRFALDRIREMPGLRGLGEDEARRMLPSLRDVFFTTPAERFAPCYSP